MHKPTQMEFNSIKVLMLPHLLASLEESKAPKIAMI